MREGGAKTREVADGVVQVFLPLPMRPTIVNVYLVRAGRDWTLIDTGMNTEDSVAAFRAALADVGIAPERITRLVGTHHHVDHFGTSGPYRELTRAEVYLHPLEAERATLMGHVGGEATEYLRTHGVPEVPPDRQLPPPSRFFGLWYSPAAPDHLPAPLAAQLVEGGRLVIPIGPPGGFQTLWKFVKQEGELVAYNLGGVAFVPLTGPGAQGSPAVTPP